MGKNKKKNVRDAAPQAQQEAPPAPDAAEAGPATAEPAAPTDPPSGPVSQPPAPVKSRLRRLLPDLIKAGLALMVIGMGAAIWYKPPLFRASFPFVFYRFQGQERSDAVLYRPLAMPTRYYIELPRQLAGRYTWFAVDRRREVAALTEAPRHAFLGRRAIKRGDELGLDLEFRKLDHSEWLVHFLPDAIVFSNAVLSVRLDTKQDLTR